MKLKKHKGKSKTKNGCYFEYVAYRTIEEYFDLDENRVKIRILDSLYCDAIDQNIRAETLEGLKSLLDKGRI